MRFTPALVAFYLLTLVINRLWPAGAGFMDWVSFALELGLDLLIVGVVHGLVARTGATPLRLLQLSFLATAVSTTNFRVLGQAFGVVLSKTMGTWLELEINAPYIAFFALGAAALGMLARSYHPRAGAIAGVASLLFGALVLCFYLAPLAATGFPLQNRILHVACFGVSALVLGAGATVLAVGKGLPPRLVAAGYMSITLSGLLFQATEIAKGALSLDTVLDLTWTFGQLAVLAGVELWQAPGREIPH